MVLKCQEKQRGSFACANLFIIDFCNSVLYSSTHPEPVDLVNTVDGQNPAPPRMMIIPLFIGF